VKKLITFAILEMKKKGLDFLNRKYNIYTVNSLEDD